MVVLKTLVETSAVGGIAFFWLCFTVESLKMIWYIASRNTKEKQKAASPEPIKQKKVMCESCYCYFFG